MIKQQHSHKIRSGKNCDSKGQNMFKTCLIVNFFNWKHTKLPYTKSVSELVTVVVVFFGGGGLLPGTPSQHGFLGVVAKIITLPHSD